MKKTRYGLIALIAIALVGLLALTSCFSQGTASSAYYDGGAQDAAINGEQMAQYVLYRFDTSESGRTLTLPAAADIVSQISSPVVGQVFIIAVTAEGAHEVTVVGGSGMTVKASAATVAGNTTQNLYFLVTDTASDSQAITVY